MFILQSTTYFGTIISYSFKLLITHLGKKIKTTNQCIHFLIITI